MSYVFDKNQIEFPSATHRDIWWWAIGMVPTEVSLTEDVREKCTSDVLEGCYQWYEYFRELCADMYENWDEYLPATPRQYRDILERAAAGGELDGDCLIWEAEAWKAYEDKINRSKAYRTEGITLDGCIEALGRLGFTIRQDGGHVIINSFRYPKIFHAMKVMECSPNVRDTQTRWHFASCEYRQLYKQYTPGYDELLRRAGDEMLDVARELHTFAKDNKLIRYVHFGIIKYKYKDVRIFDFTLQCHDTPVLRLKIGANVMNPCKADLPRAYELIMERLRSVDAA